MSDLPVDRDFLASLDPIFRLKEVKLLWTGNVYKVGQQNKLQPRILVVASPGVFLIRRRTFNFQSRIIRSLPFCDLVSLYVTGDSASFSSQRVQIRVKGPDIEKVAFLIYFIRQAQIPTDVLGFNVNLPDSCSGDSPEQSPYQPESLFLERLLSCAVSYNIIITDSMITELELPQDKTFVVTRDVMASPLFSSVLLALTYEPDVVHIRFKDLALAHVLSEGPLLCRYNRFIRSVVCEAVTFGGADEMLKKTFRAPHAFRPKEWVFVGCDLSKRGASGFFEALCLIDGPITTLSFKECRFSTSGFKTLFQTIFFNSCFHSLQCFCWDKIRVDGLMESVLELMCCSWALESKCLRQIVLRDCGIDATFFLKQCLQFDIGIREIDVSGNDLSKPIGDIETTAVHALTLLRLNNCYGVTIESMRSVFDLFKSQAMSVSDLELCNLRFENPADFSNFMDVLSELEVQVTDLFAFDDNRMNSNNTFKFVRFLEKNMHIKALSINCCIDASNSPLGLTALLSTIEKMPALESLSIASDATMDYTFGRLLLPLLRSPKMKSIKCLNIANQAVGIELMEILCDLVDNGSLVELRCDGVFALPFDTICSFYERLIESCRVFVTFPERDIDRAMSLVAPHVNEEEMAVKRSEFRRKFDPDFNKTKVVRERRRLFETSFSVPESRRVVMSPNQKKQSAVDHAIVVPKGFEDATKMNEDMAELYEECVGHAKNTVEPVISLIGSIQDALSFDNLLAACV